MPNRIIKESICTSENIDQLTEFQEIFFYRLIVNCDDFGRFDARLKLLASKLFPLRDITTEKVAETLDALRDADLIIVYEVKGHPYLQMKTWEKHQQGRAIKSKYPSFAESIMHEDESNCNQLISIAIMSNQMIANVPVFVIVIVIRYPIIVIENRARMTTMIFTEFRMIMTGF